MVMVSDGILEALPGDRKGGHASGNSLEGLDRKETRRRWPTRLLEFAKSFAGGVEDDMTALVARHLQALAKEECLRDAGGKRPLGEMGIPLLKSLYS